MRSTGFLAACCLPLILAPAVGFAEPKCSDAGLRDRYVCRELIVEYDPLAIDWAAIESRYSLTRAGDLPQHDLAKLVAPVGADVLTLADELLLEPGVLEAEPNTEYVFPECRQLTVGILELGAEARDLFHTQNALAAVGQAPAAGKPAGQGVIVAVIDTGVSRSHPELQGHLTARGIDLLPGGGALAEDAFNGIDDDGDGLTDDGYGHGTAVAGLVALIAPGAKILPVRVLDDECEGTVFDVALGVFQAVDAGARVINFSLGSLETRSVLGKAIRYARDAGAVVVSAVGNSGDNDTQSPARESDVIAVAAVDSDWLAPDWTARSSKVALVAPGVRVWVPYRSGYAEVDGTSYAVPFISAAAAMVLSIDPGLDGRGVEDELERRATSVDGVNPDLRGELGAGIVRISDLLAWQREVRRRDLRQDRRVRLDGQLPGTAGGVGSGPPVVAAPAGGEAP